MILIAALLGAEDPKQGPRADPPAKAFKTIAPSLGKAPESAKPAASSMSTAGSLSIAPEQIIRSMQPVLLFAAVSLAPAAVLMATAFVRINIVLLLLRQALGSPQVPGNQVLTALAFLLTALVMQPTGEVVYTEAIQPYRQGKLDETKAWEAACKPVKAFMLDQIERTNHASYLWKIYDEVVPEAPGRVDPVYPDDFPMRVVAPAFLLSEITTALVIGFLLYLPFLVVDLVVSAVLAAMGLFMLPPSLVSLPLKLILFVLADGWLHVAAMLLRSFGPGPGSV
jgi:flagellar biosynthetic protein FliP